MLLVPSAVKTVLSISQNGISQIALNKKLSYHLNMDIINASRRVIMSWGVSLWQASLAAVKAALPANIRLD
jgi:hypothetical protein